MGCCGVGRLGGMSGRAVAALLAIKLHEFAACAGVGFCARKVFEPVQHGCVSLRGAVVIVGVVRGHLGAGVAQANFLRWKNSEARQSLYSLNTFCAAHGFVFLIIILSNTTFMFF